MGKISDVKHPFDVNGLAPLSAFEAPQWRTLFDMMECEQADFVKHEAKFRTGQYQWPLDALHNWSRCWEYPYAYYHLSKWREGWSGIGSPKVVDLGCGVTFFPFAVAKLACDVSCTDITPVCGMELEAASQYVSSGTGHVEFRLTDGDRLPYGDCEVDAIYCVSVLEHIPNFEKTIAEMARVLKSNGILILTIDLDLRGDREIGVERYNALKQQLAAFFGHACAVPTVHPVELLTSLNGPFPMAEPRGLSRLSFMTRQWVKSVLGRPTNQLLPFYLCVEGLSLRKL